MSKSNTATMDDLDIATDYLLQNTEYRPEIGIICGSGLSGLSKSIEEPQTILYEDIPHFPKATVQGHAGELVFGKLNGSTVVCMRGRFHTYEGHDIRKTALPVRIMVMMGVKVLIVTNAAGGLNSAYNVGDIMVMGDHFNAPGLAGKHPLVGPNDDRFGDRFTPLSECYSKKLRSIAWDVANAQGIQDKVHQNGVYCFVSGPTYETPTEANFLRMIGGDAVGMSTVPEVLVAAHSGLKVLGLSLITNKVVLPGTTGIPASHQEVLDAVKDAQNDIELFVRTVVSKIGEAESLDEVPVDLEQLNVN